MLKYGLLSDRMVFIESGMAARVKFEGVWTLAEVNVRGVVIPDSGSLEIRWRWYRIIALGLGAWEKSFDFVVDPPCIFIAWVAAVEKSMGVVRRTVGVVEGAQIAAPAAAAFEEVGETYSQGDQDANCEEDCKEDHDCLSRPARIVGSLDFCRFAPSSLELRHRSLK